MVDRHDVFVFLGMIVFAIIIILACFGIVKFIDWVSNLRKADPMSDIQKDMIASELHAKKDAIVGGSFREARDLVKSTTLDVVLHEDIRAKKPDSVAGFRALLD